MVRSCAPRSHTGTRQPSGQDPVKNRVAESRSCQPISARLSPAGQSREHAAVHDPRRAPSAPPSALFVERTGRVPRLAPRPVGRVPRAEIEEAPGTSSRGPLSSNGSFPFASSYFWLGKWRRLQTALCQRFVDAQTDSYCPRNKEWSGFRGVDGASGWTGLHVRTVHVRVGCHSQLAPGPHVLSHPPAQKPRIGSRVLN